MDTLPFLETNQILKPEFEFQILVWVFRKVSNEEKRFGKVSKFGDR